MRALMIVLLAATVAACETRESEFEMVCTTVADLGYFASQTACLTSACDISDLGFLQAYDACLDEGGTADDCAPELERLDNLCRDDTSLSS